MATSNMLRAHALRIRFLRAHILRVHALRARVLTLRLMPYGSPRKGSCPRGSCPWRSNRKDAYTTSLSANSSIPKGSCLKGVDCKVACQGLCPILALMSLQLMS